MATSIFVNLPVKDLPKSMAFFKALGYSFNEQFSDENGASLVISENIYVMLLTYPKMKEFTQKEIADATKTTEVIVCLSADSRAEVDRLADNALLAGGTKLNEPMEYGFMYGRSFQDLDGHIWEVVWMDPSFVQGKQ